MSDWLLLALKGIIIGIAMAAPVGAVGVLVIRRALAERPLAGFITGLGAAVGDAIFAALAGLGMGTVAVLLETWQRPLRVIAGLIVIAIGVGLLWHARRHSGRIPVKVSADSTYLSRRRGFVTGLLLTLSNPGPLLAMFAIFAGAGLSHDDFGYADAGVLVIAIFVGSALWFGLLARSAYLLSRRYGSRIGSVFDLVGAVLLILLGLLTLFAPVTMGA